MMREWHFVFGVLTVGLGIISLIYFLHYHRMLRSFRLTLESTSDIIFVVDLQGRYVDVFASRENLLVYSRERLIGRKISDVVGPDLGSKVNFPVQQAVETGGRQVLEYSLTLQNETKHFEATFERRDSRVAVVMIRDVSSKVILTKQIEEERLRRMESVRLASLGQVAGGIAHEINTPLAVILANAQQLRRAFQNGVLDRERIEKNAERIELTSQRIAKIISGMRTLARDGARDPMESCDLVSLIQGVLDLCAERLAAKNVQVSFECPQGTQIHGRFVQLSQVILNLVNNAVDAMDEAAMAKKQIWVEVRCPDSAIEISIVDSGPGVPTEIREQLFKPFFTTKPVGKGSGLGLSISASWVKDHGGTIELVDGDARGAHFLLRFPQASLSGP